MEWFSQNWVWVLFGIAMVAMHMGHGGHGMHGGHGGDDRDDAIPRAGAIKSLLPNKGPVISIDRWMSGEAEAKEC